MAEVYFQRGRGLRTGGWQMSQRYTRLFSRVITKRRAYPVRTAFAGAKKSLRFFASGQNS